jgi:hypothetical protein
MSIFILLGIGCLLGLVCIAVFSSSVDNYGIDGIGCGFLVVAALLICSLIYWIYKGASAEPIVKSEQIFNVCESNNIQFILDNGEFVNLNGLFNRKLNSNESINKLTYTSGPYCGIYFPESHEYKVIDPTVAKTIRAADCPAWRRD